MIEINAEVPEPLAQLRIIGLLAQLIQVASVAVFIANTELHRHCRRRTAGEDMEVPGMMNPFSYDVHRHRT